MHAKKNGTLAQVDVESKLTEIFNAIIQAN